MLLRIRGQNQRGKADDRRGAIQMKQLKCSKCSKIWYVDDAELNSVNTCPFCSSQIRCKGTIGNIDTLGKAIYQAVSTGGLDLLTSSEKISGYLMDLLPDQRKEIRILTKTFDDDYLSMYRNAFEQTENGIEVTMNKLRSVFIEEEGLSDTWANMLCENCQMAIAYYQGQGIPDILSAEIGEIDLQSPNIIKTLNDADPQNASPIITTRLMAKTEIKDSSNWSVSYRVGRGMKFGHHVNGDPMHWRILAIDDNLALLHYSGSDLKQQFHDKNIDIPWKDCKLREWLNHDFIRQYFTSDEEKLIVEANIETAGVLTQDKVFCLSINEATKYKQYMKDSYWPWLLRDKGKQNEYIATYEHDGPYLWGVYTSYEIGIRPAMYISTSYFTK